MVTPRVAMGSFALESDVTPNPTSGCPWLITTIFLCASQLVQRAWVYMGFMFMAMQGAVGMVFDANNWDAPMKVVGWASNFIVIFINAKTLNDSPFKLEAPKKSKKN